MIDTALGFTNYFYTTYFWVSLGIALVVAFVGSYLMSDEKPEEYFALFDNFGMEDAGSPPEKPEQTKETAAQR